MRHTRSIASGFPGCQPLGNDKCFLAADNDGMTSFGDRLRQFREARGWSQERVSFEIEVTKATISKWETGRAEPGLDNLARLRRLFAPYGATLDYLVDDQFEAQASLRIRESPPDAVSPRIASDDGEVAILARYRALTAVQRKGLLDLLSG